MTISLDDIDYLHLSTADRIILAQDILDSVLAEAEAPAFTPAQLAEFDRRCAAVDNGTMATHRWDDVKDQLLAVNARR